MTVLEGPRGEGHSVNHLRSRHSTPVNIPSGMYKGQKVTDDGKQRTTKGHRRSNGYIRQTKKVNKIHTPIQTEDYEVSSCSPPRCNCE